MGKVLSVRLLSLSIQCNSNDCGALLSTAFFELLDRGMGIVSLHSKQYPGFRLRMNNFILEGKVCTYSPEYNYLLTFHLSDYLSMQGDPNLLADWRLKENADGTVQFESVTSPGACVGINRSGTLVKDLSIFLVVRHGLMSHRPPP